MLIFFLNSPLLKESLSVIEILAHSRGFPSKVRPGGIALEQVGTLVPPADQERHAERTDTPKNGPL